MDRNQGGEMGASFSLIVLEDGETFTALYSEDQCRSALEEGRLRPDSRITVYGADGPVAMRAEDFPLFHAWFGVLDSSSDGHDEAAETPGAPPDEGSEDGAEPAGEDEEFENEDDDGGVAYAPLPETHDTGSTDEASAQRNESDRSYAEDGIDEDADFPDHYGARSDPPEWANILNLPKRAQQPAAILAVAVPGLIGLLLIGRCSEGANSPLSMPSFAVSNITEADGELASADVNRPSDFPKFSPTPSPTPSPKEEPTERPQEYASNSAPTPPNRMPTYAPSPSPTPAPRSTYYSAPQMVRPPQPLPSWSPPSSRYTPRPVPAPAPTRYTPRPAPTPAPTPRFTNRYQPTPTPTPFRNQPPVFGQPARTAAATRPVLINRDELTEADLPRDLIRPGNQARVRYEVIVYPSGEPGSCHVTVKSGYGALDRAACRILLRKGKFRPARDSRGYAVTGTYTGSLVWQPQD